VYNPPFADRKGPPLTAESSGWDATIQASPPAGRGELTSRHRAPVPSDRIRGGCTSDSIPRLTKALKGRQSSMKMKTLITAALLLFAATSVIYLVLSESGSRVESPAEDDDMEAFVPIAVSSGAQSSEGEEQAQHKVIAYYFHGTARCATCRAIEAYAHEAVETGFPDQLQSGTLEWHAINVEEPENQHFVEDYELTTRSLVLSDMEGQSQVRWKNLDQVWDLVYDRDAFIAYVQDETTNFLGEN
jgi:hypothetical protein